MDGWVDRQTDDWTRAGAEYAGPRALACRLSCGGLAQRPRSSWLPTGDANRGLMSSALPFTHLFEAPTKGRGEEKPMDQSPASSLLGGHFSERRWRVLKKMRFLDVLWFLFHHPCS